MVNDKDAPMGVVFDLDGTLYLGDTVIPGAPAAVASLRASGARLRFVTNNPRKSRQAYAAKLTQLGIPAAPEEVLTSSNLMVRYLERSAPATWGSLLVVGETQLQQELKAAGFSLTPQAPAGTVIVSFDTTLTYEVLTQAFLALRGAARFIATNPDVYCPTPDGGLPDAGALIAALQAATGRSPEMIVGKPSDFLASELLHEFDVPPHQLLVVGDRPETDIVLGRRMGVRSLLVETGANKPRQLPAQYMPDARLDSIANLTAYLNDHG